MRYYKMPKKEIDYSKTIIYKIVCKDLKVKDTYVGSTTDFTKRKCKHKHSCNSLTNPSNMFKIYVIIRSNGGWDNWEMIEIEKYPCKDKNEATAKERYWYEKLNSNLNSRSPNRTNAEYRALNKDELQAKASKLVVCECGSTHTHHHKTTHMKSAKHQQYIKDNAGI